MKWLPLYGDTGEKWLTEWNILLVGQYSQGTVILSCDRDWFPSGELGVGQDWQLKAGQVTAVLGWQPSQVGLYNILNCLYANEFHCKYSNVLNSGSEFYFGIFIYARSFYKSKLEILLLIVVYLMHALCSFFFVTKKTQSPLVFLILFQTVFSNFDVPCKTVIFFQSVFSCQPARCFNILVTI